MKVITEAVLRDELRASKPESYTIPEGKILSPAAREYLQQCKITIVKAAKEAAVPSPGGSVKETAAPQAGLAKTQPAVQPEAVPPSPKYADYETGAFYYEKPEHMTQLYDNMLVPKDHKRISFRGKLDSLQALFILNLTILAEGNGRENLLADLNDLVGGLREMMRCDVLNEPLKRDMLIGLTHQELRAHSHNPIKYYKIKQMVLPDASLGKVYALLNQLRTQIRETECAAAAAFHNGSNYERADIIKELNRMSSAMHIMMCKYLAGMYGE